MGVSMGGGSKSAAKPTYWPGQKEAYSGVMDMMNAYMGLPTTTQSASTQNNYGNWWSGGNNNANKNSNLYAYQQPATTQATPASTSGSDYLSKLLAGYSGQLSAGFTETEKAALQAIGAYQPSELYGAGKENILATLRGDYNPITSPYYAAMRKSLLSEGEQAVTSAQQNANLYGGLSSTGMANVESKARAQTANDINTILGQLYETERGRQTNAAGQALQYEQYPLTTAQTQLQAGGYERGVNQEALDRQHQEFIRQLTALGIPLEVIMNLISAPVSTEQKSTTSPSFGFKLL
ncbi:MAG: hypothetical protein PHF74_05555 [Dehalococcoidales bacterium]|nr:hypothetical protein [Dehalococcoidales bacterium]